MWRSFLTRSHLLLSHLRRPAGCGAGRQSFVAAALGSANPRSYASDTAEVGGAKPWPRPRRHLYAVLLDEMNTGRSIYKLNIDDLNGGDEDAVAVAGMDNSKDRAPQQTPSRLPDPVLKLGFSSAGSAHFEALGDKIIITGRTRHSGVLTFVYDTKMARLDVEQPPPEGLTYCHYHAAAAGNKLYTFDSNSGPPHYLCQIDYEWVWRTSPSPLPGKSYNDGSFVRSYAVHPDGRTIVVSCAFAYRDPKVFTYSLDGQHGESTRRGDWSLPFNGQAYYDRHLDSWIGIREANGADGGKERRPYLCSCDIPDLADGEHPGKPLPAPEWKLCKEELTFFEDASNQVLVHTGRGRFCLIETTPLSEVAEDSECTCCNNDVEYLLHVTMFCAKHGKNGELVVSRCRPGRSYLVPNYAPCFFSAFWM